MSIINALEIRKTFHYVAIAALIKFILKAFKCNYDPVHCNENNIKWMLHIESLLIVDEIEFAESREKKLKGISQTKHILR